MKPSLSELIINLEEKFGKLNEIAMQCAEDFFNNHENFINSIISNKILLVISPNMLANKLQEPKYYRYRIYNGLSIVLGFLGLLTFFFNWKIAIGLLVLSFIISKISNYMKVLISRNFSEELTLKIITNPDEGMFDICQYYIAGILQLASAKGKAHLPLLPSYSLTGVEKYANKK